jgi:hypothetical protein
MVVGGINGTKIRFGWNGAQSDSLPSAHHVIHGSMVLVADMYSSTATLCEQKRWRERRRQRLSVRSYQEREDAAISLPLPSFPPALDFDPDEFTLPPPYSVTADVEKALHTIHPRRTFDSYASTLCSTIVSSDTLPPETRFVREPLPSSARRHVRVVRYVRYTLFTVYRRHSRQPHRHLRLTPESPRRHARHSRIIKLPPRHSRTTRLPRQHAFPNCVAGPVGCTAKAPESSG